MTMREKMARAIHNIDHMDSSPSWEKLEDYEREHYLNQADAALDALMEPTEGMRIASAGPGAMCRLEGVDAYEDMIRAAKEGK